MANSVKFGDDPVALIGSFPEAGAQAPDFSLAGGDLQERSLGDYQSAKVLTIYPSVDTPTCANAAKAFNERAAGLEGISVLCISKDLPFASKRFCEAEGISDAIFLSAFRDADFGRTYGVEIAEGPLRGLFARAVVIVDKDNRVDYAELDPQIKDEPDYSKALEALKAL